MFAVWQEFRVRVDVGDEFVELGARVGQGAGDVEVDRFVVFGEERGQEGSLCCCCCCCCVVEGSLGAERQGGEPEGALGSHVLLRL